MKCKPAPAVCIVYSGSLQHEVGWPVRRAPTSYTSYYWAVRERKLHQDFSGREEGPEYELQKGGTRGTKPKMASLFF